MCYITKTNSLSPPQQGEKEDDYGIEGDDYPLDDLDDGGTKASVPLSPMVPLRKVIVCFRS